MAADKVDKLDQISEQLGTLIGSKQGLSKPSFWAGILLTIITMIVTVTLSFGSLKSDLNNHIGPNGASLHLSEHQSTQIELNKVHGDQHTRTNMDAVYATDEELVRVNARLTKLENKK